MVCSVPWLSDVVGGSGVVVVCGDVGVVCMCVAVGVAVGGVGTVGAVCLSSRAPPRPTGGLSDRSVRMVRGARMGAGQLGGITVRLGLSMLYKQLLVAMPLT